MADEQALQERITSYLGKELYVIFSKPEVPPEKVREVSPAHLDHQVRLEKEGILYGAGPVFDEGADAPAFGMIVIRAGDFGEAKKIAESDPMHSTGVRSYELRRWKMNEGSFQVTINFSDQSAEIG